MNILLVMLPLSILLLIAAGVAFFWAVDHDQFDDMDTPALLPMSDALPPETTATDDSERTAAPVNLSTAGQTPPDC
ncbi:MAG: cbb3-type cytochrome oxidase assembly protein CcoS [Dokdonella sp.]